MKKALARILSFIFVCSFALLSVGCMGNDSDYHDKLIDMFNRGEITYEELQEQLKNNMPVPLYGAKVLYRPDNYKYDDNVGEGNEEYYGQYAWTILNGLVRTYGTVATDEYIDGKPQGEEPPIDPYKYYIETGKNYYYDSVRYNLYEQAEYKEKYVEVKNPTSTTELKLYNDKYFKAIESFDEQDIVTISVDTGKAWSWDFNNLTQPIGSINLNGIDDPIYDTNKTIISNTYAKTETGNFYFSNNATYYNDNANTYTLAYLGTSQQREVYDKETETYTEKYSDYVKALEYVIYCLTLELEPWDIIVTLNADGSPKVEIGPERLSADEALAYIKDIFNKIGTYVGFSPAKQAKLVDYILKNVIGQTAINADSVEINNYAIYEYEDESGNTIQDKIKLGTEKTIQVKRDYENVVKNIVNAVSTYVQIGNEGGGNPTITDRFPASSIKDYYGTNFMVASDDPFKNIEAMEYQSVVLMFREAFTVDNISLHFKYDAGNDGDSKVTNSAIDIKVYINVYKKGGERKTVATSTIRVKDGPHDYGAEGSTMMLFGIDKEQHKGYTINPFNTELAGGKLHHPDMKFDGTVSRSQPYPLTGTSIAKNYYELVEASDEAANNYYSYGRLKPQAFTAEEDCDYLEINFEVLKVIGDYTTNYKFYTGLGVVQ